LINPCGTETEACATAEATAWHGLFQNRKQLVRPGYGEALRPDERSLGEDGMTDGGGQTPALRFHKPAVKLPAKYLALRSFDNAQDRNGRANPDFSLSTETAKDIFLTPIYTVKYFSLAVFIRVNPCLFSLCSLWL